MLGEQQVASHTYRQLVDSARRGKNLSPDLTSFPRDHLFFFVRAKDSIDFFLSILTVTWGEGRRNGG